MTHRKDCRKPVAAPRNRAGLVGCIRGFALSLALVAGSFPRGADAQSTASPNVTTYHNDAARTGQYLAETILTPANVQPNTFGQLFAYALDGAVYAQPLYLSGVPVPGKGTHNVVFVATEHDSVYALDADDNSGPNANPLWKVSFINPANGITTVPWADVLIDDIVPEIGITGTPVIDESTGTLYVVAKTKEVKNGVISYVQRLHALDVHNGQERTGSPIVIGGSVPGTGTGSSSGRVSFVSRWQNQRSALLLLNGGVYITFGSHGDNGTYHGWLMGYNAQTLQQTAVFNVSPNGEGAGIWHGGSGPAADSAGNIYMSTGDGTFDAASSGVNYGDSALKLQTAGGLSVADYFTPFNQATLDQQDQDVGSSGFLVLPNTAGSVSHRHLGITGSKAGRVYLLDCDNLGGYNVVDDSQVVQTLDLTGLYGSPAYFSGWVYFGTAK